MGGSDACPHSRRTKQEDLIVCVQCGVVLDQEIFTPDDQCQSADLWPELEGTRRVPLEHADPSLRILSELTKSIIGNLQIGPAAAVAEQCASVIKEGVRRRLFNRGRSGRMAVAICLYYLGRARGISIADVSSLIGETPSELAPLMITVKSLLLETLGAEHIMASSDPSVYFEKLFPYVLTAFTIPNQVSWHRLGQSLGRFMACKALLEGRKSESLAMACLLLAVEGEGMASSKATFRQACKSVCMQANLSWNTVSLRIGELKEHLLLAARQMPLFTDVTKETLVLQLPEILRHWEHFHDNDNKMLAASDPPAFLTSQTKRNQRLHQVQQAKTRLATSNIAIDHPLSIEEIIIERLLLHSVDEQLICLTTTLKQLFDLESNTCASLDENSSD